MLKVCANDLWGDDAAVTANVYNPSAFFDTPMPPAATSDDTERIRCVPVISGLLPDLRDLNPMGFTEL